MTGVMIDTVCQSSIDDFSIFGADGKTQKISDGKNNGIVPNRKKREMGKTTVSSKKLKMGDGKNDGKRKKPENCRWEKRRKMNKNQKTADGTFDGKQKKKEKTKTKKRLPFQLGFCWKQKKKATTSLPANVCSFLVLTKMKKQKIFAFAC